ncbi:MAG: phosphatidylglycerophosphatase A [Deltaproteobacteria bacterium]|nr:phosphatidylglycerophosphatase A [Deltaproteobacteria bacterium]
MNPVALVLATGAGSGYAPVASGTFGSLVGVVLYPLISGFGPWLYPLTTLGLLSAGVWAADEFERVHHRKDDGRIVIDEIVGQLLTYFPFVLFDVPASFSWLVTGFVVFRGFDIWKPGPARWAEQSFAGGAGVMLDDVVAGLMGASVMSILILVLT